jgi:transcriptional regulator with XRE-family HTH domain
MEHRIKELIKEKGYTQQEFANVLGIARESLSRMLNSPSFPTLEKISEALDVPIWKLFASEKEVIPDADKDVITCPSCGKRFKMEE